MEVLFLTHTNMQVTVTKFPKTHYLDLNCLDLKVCNLLRCLPGKVLFEIRLKSEVLYQTISVIIVALLKCLPGKVLFEIRLNQKFYIRYQSLL